ncbi:MAG: hypothetical protein QM537_01610 [Candidatus Symbiobacter sp.]|nr:hypothetical protein [Candidatus Symbiobacter sp.]
MPPINQPNILERWGITIEQLTELVDQNPSLRGILLGYVAETKFRDLCLNHPLITDLGKGDDHDRRQKGDRKIRYKDREFIVEVKSLQTKTCTNLEGEKWVGKAQVDGSDRRIVTFSDGTQLNTTLLLKGQFDILAINCFAFGNRWRFIFCKNEDLPNSNFKKYAPEQHKSLIASLVTVNWPPAPPFTDNLIQLMESFFRDKYK